MTCTPPQSCDTFVVLPDKSKDGAVVFGKNSDRPSGEVQEVVYQPATDHPEDATVQCTYIAIPQVRHTEAVILSKPSWMWGAEMGANSKGVCVGNEAVWTKALDGDSEKVERLLGMDMVRLSLERSSNAADALSVLTSLLATHGQGGPCSDTEPDLVYHNSFLVCDNTEAWVLETAGELWVAQQVKEGYRNISNCLSIGSAFDKSSENIAEVAKEKGWWDGEGEFNFAKALGTSGADTGRKVAGEELLADLTKDGAFSLRSMLRVLRDDRSGICMCDGSFVTTSSQVSVLPPSDRSAPCHWLTGTPNPQRSVFKPFVFSSDNARISPYIQSPAIEDDPAKSVPRFSRSVDRSHLLYRRQRCALQAGGAAISATLRDIENQCIDETQTTLAALTPDNMQELDDLFKDCVDSELKFYK